jgi:Fe-S-cluster containining protein
MRRPQITDEDCRSCGACCRGSYDDDSGWADCTVDDVKRMSRAARERLVPLRHGLAWRSAHLATPASVTEQWGKLCDFLRGTPGKRVSCPIYQTRPKVCRDFKPGSRNCVDARRELGLST